MHDDAVSRATLRLVINKCYEIAFNMCFFVNKNVFYTYSDLAS